MKGLRLGVFKCLIEAQSPKYLKVANKPDHEYSIAKELGANFMTVRKILASFEKEGAAQFVRYGPRGAKIYKPTELGEKAYGVGSSVFNNVKLQLERKQELIDRHGTEAVELAVRISIAHDRRIEREEQVITPDAPPPSFEDALTIRRVVADLIAQGTKRIRFMRMLCPHCGYVGPLPGWIIFPQLRGIASTLLPITAIPCPECGKPTKQVL